MARKIKTKKKPIAKRLAARKSLTHVEHEVGGSSPVRVNNGTSKLGRLSKSRIAKLVRRIARMKNEHSVIINRLAPWVVFGLCGLVFYFFSAVTGGTFSNQDMYVVNFDHQPSKTEVNQIFRDQGVEVEKSQLVGGNTLQLRTPLDIEGFRRSAVIEKLQSENGVLSAQGYRVFPISLPERYQFRVIIAGLYLLIASIIYIAFTYRKDLVKGAKVFADLYLTVFLVGFLTAVLGIGASQSGLLTYNNAIAEIFISLLLVVTVVKVYLLSKNI